MAALVHEQLVDSASAWLNQNPVLGQNVIGIELDTGRAKFGDGVTCWGNLPYLGSGWGIPVTGGTYTGSVNFGRHIHGINTAITATIGAGAGSGAPAAVATTGSTDLGGTITWGTGTGPNSQVQVIVTFGQPWTIPGGGGPHVVISPVNAATQALGPYPASISPVSFNIYTAVTPSASQSAATYQFCYSVMG